MNHLQACSRVHAHLCNHAVASLRPVAALRLCHALQITAAVSCDCLTACAILSRSEAISDDMQRTCCVVTCDSGSGTALCSSVCSQGIQFSIHASSTYFVFSPHKQLL